MQINSFKSYSAAAMLLALSLMGCQTSPPANTNPGTQPVMSIISPAPGTSVAGPKVKIEVEVSDWKFVDANQAAKAGEGHLHFYIDTPADAIKVGEGIPLDQTTKFVHAGKAPFTSRAIELAPGQHTFTVVMGNSLHQVLAEPAPTSVTFTVN